jgi:hypothetical protein
MSNQTPDCGTCREADCPDHGQPPNLRTLGADECSVGGKVTFADKWQATSEADLRRIIGEVGVECIRLNKAVDRLAEELAAAHEVCPYHSEGGCPRPDENYNLDRGTSCDKGDRRSRRGAECWRLWAMQKREAKT